MFEGVNKIAEKDNKKKMFRHSIDLPQSALNLYFNNYKSLSDSELETLSDTLTPNLKLEYLDLLSKLNYHTSSLRTCRLDTERHCDSLENLAISTQSKHGARNVQTTLHSLTPKSELCTPQLVIHKIDSDSNVEHSNFSHLYLDGNGSDFIQSELSHSYMENLPKYDNEDFLIRDTTMWNLEPHCHALLSPHSSNGSISSFRSSNTDSVIEMLTPDEEFPDHLMPDMTVCSQLLLNSQQSNTDKTSTLWDRSQAMDGDNSNVQLTVTTTKTIPIYSETTFSTNINTSLVYLDSSCNLNITQRTSITDTTLVDGGTDTTLVDGGTDMILVDEGTDMTLVDEDTNMTLVDGGTNMTLVDGGTNMTLVDGGTNMTLVDGGTNMTLVDGGTNMTLVDEGTNMTLVDEGSNMTSVDGGTNTTLVDGSTNTILVDGGPGRSFLRSPSVVISDFSSDVGIEEQCYQTAVSEMSQDLRRVSQTSFSNISQDSDMCSQTVFFSDIAWNSQSNVLEDHLLYHHTLSNNSVSSNESSISIYLDSLQDLEEQQVFQKNVKSELRPWKKIQNVVHWAPFIQQFKRCKYPWIQLAGHQGNFQAGEPGAILKKYDPIEHRAFKKLMMDVLQMYVPKFCGEQVKDGVRYLWLQDLLCEFEAPFVMDVKMGCRTYLEEELKMAREKPSLRKDMYQKMVEVDLSAPTAEENQHKAVTKARYMQWRDEMSSTMEMGFRIEGIRKSDGAQVKNFKTTKERANIKRCLKQFVEENPVIINKYLRRLKAIRESQEISPFLKGHEVIGSSLLFVHDKCEEACIWMIDFGKTVPLPENVSITHRLPWQEGNREDGYLFGVDSLVKIFEEMSRESCPGLCIRN